MLDEMERPRRGAVRTRVYWLRLARLFLVALVGALFLLPFLMGAFSMWVLTRGLCTPGGSPAERAMPYEDVLFPSARGITQQGYFIPGTNGATIILIPAFKGGRGSELYYAEVFHRAGFNVLTFNSRVCTSQGWISLGYQEVEDVEAAYEYLKTRPDVDAARVGLHGFSSAGATGLMAMARMPAIRSVSAEGGYHDYAEMLGWGRSTNFFDTLYQLGAVTAYPLLTGGDIHDLNPLDAIGKIGPRPVLLVYGSREVSLAGARLMLERARANGVDADLWVVEGAGHGGYLWAAPDEFVTRVVGFHEAALLAVQDGESPS